MSVQIITAPKIEDLQPLIRQILETAPFFVALSVGADPDPAPDSSRVSIVVEDDGTKDKRIETHLRTRGVCVVVQPVLLGRTRNQDDTEWLLDCEVMVKVMVDPTQNATGEGGARTNIYKMITAAINAVCRAKRHPGGERFKLAIDPLMLSAYDSGLFAYDLVFQKETVA